MTESMGLVPRTMSDQRRLEIWSLLERVNVLLYLLALLIAFGIAAPQAFTVGTASTVAQLSIPLLVVASGMTLCLVAGEVDLSVAGVAGLASTVVALAMSDGLSWPLAVGLALCCGIAVGTVNGALTAWLAPSFQRFPSFLVTLATLSATMGIAQSLQPLSQAIAINSAGFATVFGFNPSVIGSGPTWMTLAILALAHIVLTRTRFGYAVAAIGTNARAAELVGLHVLRTRFFVMIASSTFAAAAGVLFAGFVGAGFSTIARGVEVDAIAAAVIGGTALFGGCGTIGGTVLGVFILGVLNTGLLVLQVPTNGQLMIKGALVVLALALGEQLRRRTTTR